MTDELSERRQARQTDPIRSDAVRVLGAAEVARIDADSAAMVLRGAAFERVLADRLARIAALRQGGDGLAMLTCVAEVIALEHLRCAALGVHAEPTWQAALEQHRVFNSTTIEQLKPILREEASN